MTTDGLPAESRLPDAAFGELRAALAATPEPDGLDVERLARAITVLRVPDSRDVFRARQIAERYARSLRRPE